MLHQTDMVIESTGTVDFPAFSFQIQLVLQSISVIFLGVNVTSDINSACVSTFRLVREKYDGWWLCYLHSNGA